MEFQVWLSIINLVCIGVFAFQYWRLENRHQLIGHKLLDVASFLSNRDGPGDAVIVSEILATYEKAYPELRKRVV